MLWGWPPFRTIKSPDRRLFYFVNLLALLGGRQPFCPSRNEPIRTEPLSPLAYARVVGEWNVLKKYGPPAASWPDHGQFGLRVSGVFLKAASGC
jgi:hypothetical protein